MPIESALTIFEIYSTLLLICGMIVGGCTVIIIQLIGVLATEYFKRNKKQAIIVEGLNQGIDKNKIKKMLKANLKNETK